MVIGFRSQGFGLLPIEETQHRLGLMGFRALELCVDSGSGRDCLATSERTWQLEGEGCEIWSVSHHGDYVNSPVTYDELLRALPLAAHTPSRALVVSSPSYVGRDRSELRRLTWEALHELAQAAAKLQVKVAVEPEPGLIVETAADCLALMDELGDANLGVNADIGHLWLTEEDPLESVSRLQGHLFHCHITDLAGGIHKHLVPGTGDLPLCDAVQALQEADFRGPLIIDLWQLGQAPFDTAEACLLGLGSSLE